MKKLSKLLVSTILCSQVAWAQQLSGALPAANSQTSNHRPTIAGTFAEDVEGAQIFVDGTEFTGQARISGRNISWTPGYDLDNGVHKVQIVGKDILGQTVGGRWQFEIVTGQRPVARNEYRPANPGPPTGRTVAQQPGYGLPQAPANYSPSGPAATSYWTSSTGSSVAIVSRDSGLEIRITGSNGATSAYAGRWLRKYDLFDYTVNGLTYTGQLSGQRVDVTSPRTNPVVWTQVQQSAPARPQPAQRDWGSYLQGRWASNSGNYFDVQNQGASLLITCFSTDGRQYQGSGSWIDATSFRYRLAGYNSDSIATFMSDGRLKVIRDGKANYWTKQ